MPVSFRLYGAFIWPPTLFTPSTATVETGVVEVHHLRWKGTYRAALAWFPGKVLGSNARLVARDIASLQKNFAGSASASNQFAVWIDEVAAAGGLAFRGASLLRQYQRGEQILQWPLVRQCEYAAKKIVQSGLRIEAASNDATFDLRINLPIPVEQSKISSTRAFPFSARYAAISTVARHLRPIGLRGGWSDEDTAKGGTSFDVDTLPSEPVLGSFGFTENGAANPNFIVYEGGGVATRRNWPSTSKTFVEHMLEPYGFALAANAVDKFRYTGIKGPTELSLRFPKTREGVTANSLIYRARVKPVAAISSGDLRSSGEGETLRLRLVDELGGNRTEDVDYGSNRRPSDPQLNVAGWLETGADLAADCALSWDIHDGNIWSEDRASDWSLKFTLRLLWSETIAALGPGDVKEGTVFIGGLLANAKHAFTTTRDALLVGEAGQPHSFLPDLEVAEGPATFCLYGSPISAKMEGATGLLSWASRAYDYWKRPGMRLGLASEYDLIAGAPEAANVSITLRARGQNFFLGKQKPSLQLLLSHDESWPPSSLETIDEGEPFFASYRIDLLSVSRDWTGRLGSLGFAGENLSSRQGGSQAWIRHTETLGTGGHLRVGGNGARFGHGYTATPSIYPEGRAAAQIRLSLPVSRVKTLTTDMPRMDRTGRAPPLLIPMFEEATSSNVYWLRATETVSARQDRRVEADIIEDSTDQGERSYVVLSTEPFALYRFTSQPLSDRGQADSASVAVYSGDDRVWQYKKVSDLYHYSLPPQAIGESADKPRRLEIHDLPDGSTEDPPRPFVTRILTDGHGKEVLDEEESNARRRAVDFRLTPSAEIWIRPSDVERGYFMPESAAHEIFRQFGAYGMGAALAFLRAEFLYGLSVGVNVAKERSIARGARIAEIEALVGQISGLAIETDADRGVADRWAALRTAFLRRPERLEVWAHDLDSTVAFTPAKFSDGVQFSLRGTALHRAPLIDLTAERPDNEPGEAAPEGRSATNDWPLIGGSPPPADAEDVTAPSAPRHHPQGLAGGALWPVESLNLFNALLSSPLSRGGSIENIALSPTGGDATQKAEFLDGKVSIISETRNGRVQRQQVEVLGRVCAFWHRAKHVVVYERTVNPSAQFAPKYDEDPNRTRSRRPILRKVREYIELLQPERCYPDFETAAPRSAGFLDRVRFNSRIIPVDSAWSSDVGDYGWQVPLWNRLAARERPQVYPMPDVAFVTVGEGQGERPLVAQECRDPDCVYFFADFKISGSDTDTWPARLSLDFPNMPRATELAEVYDRASSNPKPAPSQGNGGDLRRPAVARILPGLRRFTWRLSPSAQKTAINAGRSGKPLYVGVDSVSFMRATHAAGPSNTLPTNIRDLFDVKLSPDPVIGDLKYWSADGDGVSDEIRALSDIVGKGGLFDQALSQADFKSAKDALVALWGKPNDPTTGVQAAIAGIAGGKTFDDLRKLKSGLASGGAYCARLKDDAAGLVKRKEMLVRAALGDWLAETDELLRRGELCAGATTRAEIIADLTSSIVGYIEPVFLEASADVSKLQEGVEKARAALADLGAEIEAVIDRARARVHQFDAGYDKNMPWSPARRAAFRAGIIACVSSVEGDIVAAIGEARQRLHVELNSVAQAVAGHISKAIAQIEVAQGEALASVVSVRALVDVVLAGLEDYLGKADSNKFENTIRGFREQATKNLKNYPDILDIVDKRLAYVETALSITRASIAKLWSLSRNVDAAADQAEAGLIAELDAVSEGFHGFGQDLQTAVADLAAMGGELINTPAAALAAKLQAADEHITMLVAGIADSFAAELAVIGNAADAAVKPPLRWLDAKLERASETLKAATRGIAPIVDDAAAALSTVQDSLSPDKLLVSFVKPKVIAPALEAILAPLAPEFPDVSLQINLVRSRLSGVVDEIGQRLREFSAGALNGLEGVSEACAEIFEGVAEAEELLNKLADPGQYLEDSLKNFPQYQAFEKAYADFENGLISGEELVDKVRNFDRSVRALYNTVSRTFETAQAYTDRVLDEVGRLGDGGLLAAPSNVLKLYSAVTSAPEIAALKADIDRMRSAYDEVSDIIDTTRASALFGRLGDELKAVGLSIPFDKIGERILPANLENFEIGKVFRNFGGANLDHLFKGYTIPSNVRDAIRITHDFDEKEARAWVQIDIKAPFPGRRSLFSLGIFKADFVDMELSGRVRLEASKDGDTVTTTGHGRIGTVIDTVVGGQSMVRLEKFGLNFSKEAGLQVDFDPKNIRLNPQFKFIQDFLANIFPDQIGGMTVVKDKGMPVGLEHQFAMPFLSANAGTSGIQNLSLNNRFKLVAFPDFILANRFGLSTMERPFIFSIFVIGGAGHVQIESQYRPFNDELTVMVDASAGGSASLAVAFAAFSGQVFITLSGVLNYRKLIGRGSGLTISMVLVIAGHVDVAGIVTVGVTFTLRLTYQDSGQIDADGTLSVEIRISEFFKLKARGQARYKLRGGRSEASVTTGVSADVEDKELQDKARKLQEAANKLQEAMN